MSKMELFSISTTVLDIQDSFGQEEMNDLFEWLADYEEDNIANGMDEASTDSSGLSLVVSEKQNTASTNSFEVDIISEITYWLDNDNRIYRMDVEGFSVDKYESMIRAEGLLICDDVPISPC
eukprot:gene5809-6397_t